MVIHSDSMVENISTTAIKRGVKQIERHYNA